MRKEKTLLENVENRILNAELIFWTCFIDADQPECKSYVDVKMRQWLSSTQERNTVVSQLVNKKKPVFSI